MAQLWGGRFTKETDQLVYNFNASISFDQKFYAQDIEGSMAHVKMLAKQGSPYLQFLEVILETGKITIHEMEQQFIAFQKENGFSDEDMQALKKDDFERLVADTLLVRQIVSDPERAELIGFSQAKSVLDSVGVFEDNKMVEGYVTVCAKDENYGESLYDKGMTGYRYIMENDVLYSKWVTDF